MSNPNTVKEAAAPYLVRAALRALFAAHSDRNLLRAEWETAKRAMLTWPAVMHQNPNSVGAHELRAELERQSAEFDDILRQ